MTLIELAITIALVGIVAALIVNFVAPVRSYIDTSRRAALADAADTALRRIGRDLRLALPNSVRVTTAGGIVYLEMLLVRTGGRYRSESDPAATNTCPDGAGSTPADDVLAIGVADDCFKTLGDVPNVAQINTATDHLVVFNMPPGTPNADAYEYSGTGGNKTAIQTVADGSGSERFVFPAAHAFTYESPGKRFFVIEGPVTYACSTAAGTMLRYSGYAIASTQPAPPGGTGALMVDKVSGCSFTYDSSVSSQGAGLVTLSLQLTMQDSQGASETVSLYHAVHVNNVP